MLESVAAAEPTSAVYHVIYEDGTAGRIEVTAGAVPELARPGCFVEPEDYQARIKALEDLEAAVLADEEATQHGQALADYTALTLLGLAEETARRLSGYNGPGRPES
ncbi:hypothetical protein [Streptomyces sp. Root369]|uniref:hypothetical protein n=1 Tax=Streptomyces sp. Root369 TaxID=1736523 RepID=UPI000B195E6C|nr:hypothetical protein [Streptomyces sp. Root369]